mmetsp:Transcript_28772/g.66429  ORF Transcript_28772/g.66429 Transcript_28772/m.66429 type:complete len:257 (+) Transcript_28772:44-814(+)
MLFANATPEFELRREDLVSLGSKVRVVLAERQVGEEPKAYKGLVHFEPYHGVFHVIKELNIFKNGSRVFDIDYSRGHPMLRNCDGWGHVFKEVPISELQWLKLFSLSAGAGLSLGFTNQRPYKIIFADPESRDAFIGQVGEALAMVYSCPPAAAELVPSAPPLADYVEDDCDNCAICFCPPEAPVRFCGRGACQRLVCRQCLDDFLESSAYQQQQSCYWCRLPISRRAALAQAQQTFVPVAMPVTSVPVGIAVGAH